jgi:hypothetical protein
MIRQRRQQSSKEDAMRTLTLLFCTLLLLCGLSFGQQTGTATFGAADSFTVDSVDLATLTPSVSVPILHKNGAIPVDVTAFISTPCWGYEPDQEIIFKCKAVTPVFTPNFLTMTAGYAWTQNAGSCQLVSEFYVGDPGDTLTVPATRHYFSTTGLDTCTPSSVSGWAVDNSGLWLSVTMNANTTLTYQVYTSSGAHTEQATGGQSVMFSSIADSFGNEVSTASGVITDTLNTSALTINGTSYSWLNASGTEETLSFSEQTDETIDFGSNFNCPAGLILTCPQLSFT